jgi:hypothetical protein
MEDSCEVCLDILGVEDEQFLNLGVLKISQVKIEFQEIDSKWNFFEASYTVVLQKIVSKAYFQIIL